MKHKRILAVIASMGVMLSVFQFSGLPKNVALMFVRDQFAMHPAVGLLTFVVLFSLGNLIFIPGWGVLAAVVLALGRTMGGLATHVAAGTSCVVTFVIIRGLGCDLMRQIDSVTTKRISRDSMHIHCKVWRCYEYRFNRTSAEHGVIH